MQITTEPVDKFVCKTTAQLLEELRREVSASCHKAFMAQTSTTLLLAGVVGRELDAAEIIRKIRLVRNRKRIVEAVRLLALASNDLQGVA